MEKTDLLPYLRRIQQMQIQYWGKLSIECSAQTSNTSSFVTAVATSTDNKKCRTFSFYTFLSKEENDRKMKEFENEIPKFTNA